MFFFIIILPSVFLLAMPFGLSICAVIGDICTQSNLGEYQRRINKTFLYYESQIAGNKHVFIIFRMISYSGTVVCCYIVKCGVSQFPWVGWSWVESLNLSGWYLSDLWMRFEDKISVEWLQPNHRLHPNK